MKGIARQEAPSCVPVAPEVVLRSAFKTLRYEPRNAGPFRDLFRQINEMPLTPWIFGLFLGFSTSLLYC